jgi:hypothetical protein
MAAAAVAEPKNPLEAKSPLEAKFKRNMRKKDAKPPGEVAMSVAQALLDLEATSDLKAQLRELQICGVKEIDVPGKKVSSPRESHRSVYCRRW